MSLAPSFRGSKVRQKTICEKFKNLQKLSKCSKNQDNTKLHSKKCLESWKSVIKCIIYSQLRDTKIFSKIHKTDKKNLLAEIKKTCLLRLNEKTKFQGFS
jgi:hypothetical protein